MKAWKLIKLLSFLSYSFVIVIIFITCYEKDRKPSGEIKPLTIVCNDGGLGNQMYTYASLYGIARHNNRVPESFWCNMKYLLPAFEITTKVINSNLSNEYVEYEISDILRKQDLHIPHNVTLLTGNPHAESYTFYHEFKDEIRKEFTFKPVFKQYVEKTLLELGNNRRPNVYVGIHVRRTNYCHHLRDYRGRMFDMKYLEKAMTHFRAKYQRVLFVVVSDDRNWCRKTFGRFQNVVVSPEPPDRLFDLALLASCNHSIITYGTFGYWGAYLAGGETVYFTDFLSPDSLLLRLSPNYLLHHNPPEWLGISTTPDGFWSNYTVPDC